MSTLSYGFIPSASASTLKEVKSETATWTTDQSVTSSSFIAVTDATCTISGLNASKNYDLFAWADFPGTILSVINNARKLQLVINETTDVQAKIENTLANEVCPMTLMGGKINVTGSTSYVVSVNAARDTAGTFQTNVYNLPCRIMVLAVEQ
jgi:hypothetical protein